MNPQFPNQFAVGGSRMNWPQAGTNLNALNGQQPPAHQFVPQPVTHDPPAHVAQFGGAFPVGNQHTVPQPIAHPHPVPLVQPPGTAAQQSNTVPFSLAPAPALIGQPMPAQPLSHVADPQQGLELFQLLAHQNRDSKSVRPPPNLLNVPSSQVGPHVAFSGLNSTRGPQQQRLHGLPQLPPQLQAAALAVQQPQAAPSVPPRAQQLPPNLQGIPPQMAPEDVLRLLAAQQQLQNNNISSQQQQLLLQQQLAQKKHMVTLLLNNGQNATHTSDALNQNQLLVDQLVQFQEPGTPSLTPHQLAHLEQMHRLHPIQQMPQPHVQQVPHPHVQQMPQPQQLQQQPRLPVFGVPGSAPQGFRPAGSIQAPSSVSVVPNLPHVPPLRVDKIPAPLHQGPPQGAAVGSGHLDVVPLALSKHHVLNQSVDGHRNVQAAVSFQTSFTNPTQSARRANPDAEQASAKQGAQKAGRESEQPLSFAQFILSQPDQAEITPGDAQTRYDRYLSDFSGAPNGFFDEHAKEDWFRERYHPARLRRYVRDAQKRFQARAIAFGADAQIAISTNRVRFIAPSLAADGQVPEDFLDADTACTTLFIRLIPPSMSRRFVTKICRGDLISPARWSEITEKPECTSDELVAHNSESKLEVTKPVESRDEKPETSELVKAAGTREKATSMMTDAEEPRKEKSQESAERKEENGDASAKLKSGEAIDRLPAQSGQAVSQVIENGQEKLCDAAPDNISGTPIKETGNLAESPGTSSESGDGSSKSASENESSLSEGSGDDSSESGTSRGSSSSSSEESLGLDEIAPPLQLENSAPRSEEADGSTASDIKKNMVSREFIQISLSDVQASAGLTRLAWIYYKSQEAAQTAREALQGFKILASDVRDAAEKDDIILQRLEEQLDDNGSVASSSFGGEDASASGDEKETPTEEQEPEQNPSSTHTAGSMEPQSERKSTGAVVYEFDPAYNRIKKKPRTAQMKLLDACFSTPDRLAHDFQLAKQIMEHLDRLRRIENDSISEDLLSSASTDGERLDIVAAYLRRVHMYCYYTGKEYLQEWFQIPASPLRQACGTERAAQGEERETSESERAAMNGVDAHAERVLRRTQIEDAQLLLSAAQIGNGINGEGGADLAESEKVTSEISSLARDKKYDKVRLPAESAESSILQQGLRSAGQRARERARRYWEYDNCVPEGLSRKRCRLCEKLFKGIEFLNKHLATMHQDELRKVLSQVDEALFFKNYLSDPRKLTSKDVKPMPISAPPQRNKRGDCRSEPGERGNTQGAHAGSKRKREGSNAYRTGHAHRSRYRDFDRTDDNEPGVTKALVSYSDI